MPVDQKNAHRCGCLRPHSHFMAGHLYPFWQHDASLPYQRGGLMGPHVRTVVYQHKPGRPNADDRWALHLRRHRRVVQRPSTPYPPRAQLPHLRQLSRCDGEDPISGPSSRY
ncbi:hypothetical protein BV898_04931 [Hypsibius exemplaris]|uniref:Uncharacterized protein n=1 Tax=Hypsibius exemplaris TaxID=2072580 RepID=A0A1W0X153_HYPEX|nr:hypothetical protein BV898_04931 [Hypsibius exemplaris]